MGARDVTMHFIKNAAAVSDPAYNCDALVDADGSYIYFEKDINGNVQPNYATGYILSVTTTGWSLSQRGGNSWTFDSGGALQTITDPLGRSAHLSYSGDHLTGISDSANRTVYTLTWSGNHIEKITDLAGRTISYSYDANGNLTAVKHDTDTIFSYSYNSNHGLTGNSNAITETWRVSYR